MQHNDAIVLDKMKQLATGLVEIIEEEQEAVQNDTGGYSHCDLIHEHLGALLDLADEFRSCFSREG